MAEAGELTTSNEQPKSLALTLSTHGEQKAILAALTSYIPSHAKESHGQTAKDMFQTINHHIDQKDEPHPVESFTLNLESAEEQKVLRAALFSRLHEDTAAETLDSLKGPTIEYIKTMRDCFKKVNQHLGAEYQLTELQKLSIGIVEDISDERLKEIAIDTDPQREVLKHYAEHYLQARAASGQK